MKPYPDRNQAHILLSDAETANPGPWTEHSRVTAQCAEKIAKAAGMDSNKAYVLGLLHDIGRKFGVRHLGHVYDGWWYMTQLGYDAVARVCLTHSFSTNTLNGYIGKWDISCDQQRQLQELLESMEYDDYDRLVQLCDCLAGSEGVVDIEARMTDVRRRYGSYPQEKWDANLALRCYFEEKTGQNIYDVVK